MANAAKMLQDTHETKSTDCEDVEKVLMVIVKRRKTIPAKCMDINKEISKYELLRLSWPVSRTMYEPFYWQRSQGRHKYLNLLLSAYAVSSLSNFKENAKIVTEEYKEKEKFKRIIQGFKRLKSFHFTLDDINEAEQKLNKYYKRIQEINCYLEKGKKVFK